MLIWREVKEDKYLKPNPGLSNGNTGEPERKV
jgi:hypothetical protein